MKTHAAGTSLHALVRADCADSQGAQGHQNVAKASHGSGVERVGTDGRGAEEVASGCRQGRRQMEAQADGACMVDLVRAAPGAASPQASILQSGATLEASRAFTFVEVLV